MEQEAADLRQILELLEQIEERMPEDVHAAKGAGLIDKLTHECTKALRWRERELKRLWKSPKSAPEAPEEYLNRSTYAPRAE